METDGQGAALFRLRSPGLLGIDAANDNGNDGAALKFWLFVQNLEGVTQAHIHCGAPDVNGPVVAFLFGFVAEGVTVTNGLLASGAVRDADVIPRPGSEVCPGGVSDFAELVEKIRSGEAYVNVHTIANPPGEIRGQIR